MRAASTREVTDDNTDREAHGHGPGGRLVVVADPETPVRLARRVAGVVADDLDRSRPRRAPWTVDVRDGAFAAGTDLAGLADRLAPPGGHGDADVVLGLTDLPPLRRRDYAPSATDPERRTGVVSLPALGGLALRSRVRTALAGAAAAIDAGVEDDSGHGRRLAWVRLLGGVVRANRPWRLLTGLSGALAASLAAGAFTGINPTMWALAVALAPVRLVVATLSSVALFVGWLIVRHGLWELPGASGDAARLYPVERRLRNASTVATLLVGVGIGYAALFIALFGAALVVVDGGELARILGRDAGVGVYLRIAWLATSAATVAGAVGSSLENEAAAERAAYGRRERQRRARERHQDRTDRAREDRRATGEAEPEGKPDGGNEDARAS